MAALVTTSNASATLPRQGATVASRTVKSSAMVKGSTNRRTLPMESRSIAEVNAGQRKKQVTESSRRSFALIESRRFFPGSGARFL